MYQILGKFLLLEKLKYLVFLKFTFQFLSFPSGSTKIHIVLDHLEQFVESKGALGPFSEQASESVRADWKKTWNLYNTYPGDDRLMRCVLKYNKKHL